MSDYNRDDQLRDILAQLTRGDTEPEPAAQTPAQTQANKKAQADADARDREDNLRAGYFLKNAGVSDADTRAAALRQINAALKTL